MIDRTSAAEPDKGTYRSYVLRLWQEDVDMPWRGSIQEVTTGEIIRFGTVEALLAFIAAETGTVGEEE